MGPPEWFEVCEAHHIRESNLFGVWESAVMGDSRVVNGTTEPWPQVRAFCHMVKARWLCHIARRDPGKAPICDMMTILELHDKSQKLLVESQLLPEYCLIPGSSTAFLAKKFPEEHCPHYIETGDGRATLMLQMAMGEPIDGDEAGDEMTDLRLEPTS